MLTREEIVTRLQAAGFAEDRVEAIIADVMQVVLGRALADYIAGLSERQREKLKDMKGDDLVRYIADHKGELPEPSAADFEKKYEETWEEYFQAMA